MYNKKDVFKRFLNIDNVPDAWMFTGKSFHSRGAAVLNATLPLMPLVYNVETSHPILTHFCMKEYRIWLTWRWGNHSETISYHYVCYQSIAWCQSLSMLKVDKMCDNVYLLRTTLCLAMVGVRLTTCLVLFLFFKTSHMAYTYCHTWQ